MEGFAKNLELYIIQLTGQLDQKAHFFTKVVGHHWVANESLIKLNNSTKERRTRLARHRNLYNTHLMPQEVQVSSTTNTCVCGA